MAILVRLLMLVACGPLLAPPGFCLCKAGQAGGTAPHGQPVASRAADPAPPHPPDRCRHRHTAPRAADSSPPVQPTPPAPHDDHAPGCPAAGSSGRLQWVEPTADADDAPVTVTVAFTGVRRVPVMDEFRPADRTLFNCSCSPPLYLKHCSLVI